MRTLTLSLGVCVVLLAAAAPAHAEQPDYDSAKRHFLTGRDLFERREFLRAAQEFQAAYDITKDPVVLFNIGEAYEKAGKVDEAIRAYEAYLGASSVADREEVERKLAALRRQRSRQQIPPPSPTPTPAPTPMPAPTPIPARPEPLASPPEPTLGPGPEGPGAAGQTAQGPPLSNMRIGAIVATVLSVGLLTTAGMLQLSVQSREDDVARMQQFVDPVTGRPLDYNSGTNAAQYQSLQDDGRTYRNLALAFAGAGVAAGVGAVLLFVYDKGPSEAAPVSALSLIHI